MVELEQDAQHGLVVLRFHQPYAEGDEDAYLAALDRIAAIAGRFVLLTIFGGGPGLSRAGERAQALWFKQHRQVVAERCRALAMVRPEASAHMEEVFRKLWGFPVLATADEAAARRFLAAHMSAE